MKRSTGHRLREPARSARIAIGTIACLAAIAVGGCAYGRPVPPETFDWCGKPVAFSPPPGGWRRERLVDGDWTGLRFVRKGRTVERITIADHRAIAEAAHGAALRLADAIGRVTLGPERRVEPGPWTVTREESLQVAGEPAIGLTFARRSDGRIDHGREVYVVSGGHLFVAAFHGHERTQRLFDRIVGSIAFPAAPDTVAAGQRFGSRVTFRPATPPAVSRRSQ
jgi:hypothetical protein